MKYYYASAASVLAALICYAAEKDGGYLAFMCTALMLWAIAEFEKN